MGATAHCAAVLAETGAENYPAQPIKIVAPFPAGGSVDILARAVGQKLQESWGQPVVGDNKGGGNGIAVVFTV